MTFSRLKNLIAPSIVATTVAMTVICASAQVTGPTYEGSTESVAAAEDDIDPQAASVRFDLIAGDLDHRIDRLLEEMTLDEKVGQLVQVYPDEEQLSPELAKKIKLGKIGSLFFPGKPQVIIEAQRIATNESRLGIPLLIARDVVHGFRTISPIPLGQAASWNPELVECSARDAAHEARAEGVDWTFAPMIDICRNPRWGRIAETLGEDTTLASEIAAAMVRGFQDEQDGELRGVIACAKHFVGYGFSEGGRDYNRVSISNIDLHNVVLPPFRASVDAGCRTLMTSFSELNGVPGTAHAPLINGLLKRDWNFSGFVVSDWGSIDEMVVHGHAADQRAAAKLAMSAGVDMDMCSQAYAKHLKQLVLRDRIS